MVLRNVIRNLEKPEISFGKPSSVSRRISKYNYLKGQIQLAYALHGYSYTQYTLKGLQPLYYTEIVLNKICDDNLTLLIIF